jgi:hypothetical protein
VDQYGADVVKNIASAITYESVMAALRRSPAAQDSVLLEFGGKKWLKEALKIAGEVK